MHQIVRSIKRILPADLPAAADAELLNLGIVSLGDDLYSCCEQLRSDDELAAELGTREGTWAPHGEPIAGETLAAGDVRERHAKLSADVRAKIMRADVYRAVNPTKNAREMAEANILEQQAAIKEYVGDVVQPDGELAPLVDFEAQPDPVLAEAERMAAMPDSVVVLSRVTMGEIDEATDVVRTQDIVPHRWAGER
jgi:hypothetical protein